MSMQQPPKPSKRRKLDHVTSMEELPDHIIDSVLLKLPVKSLIRFCSLSKRWEETIMSPRFAKQHMKSLKEGTSSSTAVGSYNIIIKRISSYFEKSVADFFSGPISSAKQIIQLVKMSFVSEQDFDRHDVFLRIRFQSCDGLLCVGLIGLHESASVIYICNPAIGKHKKLTWPLSLDGILTRNYFLMGFGYQASIDDYKIVFFVPEMVDKWIVHVMSLKENIWRVIDLKSPPPNGLPLHLSRHNDYYSSVSVGGDVYWIVSREEWHGILKFNLADESFSIQPLPRRSLLTLIEHKIVTLNESLFLISREADGAMSKVDIWMLVGDKTWSKVHTIPMLLEDQFSYQLIGLNLNGHVIMVNRWEKCFAVYIPQEKRFLKLNVDENGKPGFGRLHIVQMETLVSP